MQRHQSLTETPEQPKSEAGPSTRPEDDWSNISDPNQRRRVQNRIAQRKFREKSRQRRQERDRDLADRNHAGAAYEAPNPEDLDGDGGLSGLPWGSFSMKHVVETGKAKEERDSQRTSREGSANTGAQVRGPMQFQTSHSVGLLLSQNFARGGPAWQGYGPHMFLNPWPGGGGA